MQEGNGALAADDIIDAADNPAKPQGMAAPSLDAARRPCGGVPDLRERVIADIMAHNGLKNIVDDGGIARRTAVAASLRCRRHVAVSPWRAIERGRRSMATPDAGVFNNLSGRYLAR